MDIITKWYNTCPLLVELRKICESYLTVHSIKISNEYSITAREIFVNELKHGEQNVDFSTSIWEYGRLRRDHKRTMLGDRLVTYNVYDDMMELTICNYKYAEYKIVATNINTHLLCPIESITPLCMEYIALTRAKLKITISIRNGRGEYASYDRSGDIMCFYTFNALRSLDTYNNYMYDCPLDYIELRKIVDSFTMQHNGIHMFRDTSHGLCTHTYVDGKLDGRYQIYRVNQLVCDAIYIDGERCFNVIDGQIKPLCSEIVEKKEHSKCNMLTFHRGKLIGRVVCDDDDIHTIAYYENNVKHGVCETYVRGILNSIEHYRYGKQEGEYIKYNRDGTIHQRIMYKDDLMYGYNIIYYDNSVIHVKSNYVNGKLDGERQEYNFDGKLIRISQYVNDILHGFTIEWNWDIDKLGCVAGYHNGKYHGTYREWDGDVLSIERQYVYGSPHGTWREWSSNGMLASICTYNRGKLEGEYIVYYLNSTNIHIRKYYRHGITDGLYENWHSNGNLHIRGMMYNDYFIDSFEQYDEHGKLLMNRVGRGIIYHKDSVLHDPGSTPVYVKLHI